MGASKTGPTVATSWQSYADAVMPKDAGAVQVQETQRGFYAGAYFMLMTLAFSISDETPDEEGVALLERLKAECEAFAADQPRTHVEADPPPRPPMSDIAHTIADVADMRALTDKLQNLLIRVMPAGWGFVLLMFTFGEGGSLFYAANADRGDVINVMREFIQKQTQ